MQKIERSGLLRMLGDRAKLVDTKTCEVCDCTYHIVEAELPNGETVMHENCPSCLIKAEDERMKKEAAEQYKQNKKKQFNWLSVPPVELEGTTLDQYKPENFSQKSALETINKFINDELTHTTLFFQGDTGLGKTHLAYCTYRLHQEKFIPSLFIDLPSLLSTIRNSYNDRQAHSQDKIMNAIKEADLLVLDDVGAEYVKPDANGYESWAADILFQVANARQAKKNIYTTNFTAKHLTKKYGMMSKRIISRMMNNAKVIKVEGDDHRLKGLE